MARSLAGGDYRLLMSVESASRAGSWYRICTDIRSGTLSCDCHSWTFAGGAPAERSCKHTDLVRRLSNQNRIQRAWHALMAQRVAEAHPLINATREQWAGLTGAWTIEERDAAIGRDSYHLVLIRLVTANGTTASGGVAFANRHRPTTTSMVPGVAGWAGYAIAAEVARAAGYQLVGQPPEHFRAGRGRRGSTQGTDRIGLADILRVGERADLGDGLTPKERAARTLQLFLGPLYTQLETQGFLDVSSQRYPQRVYRLRRDPQHLRDRRVRVFERGHYVRDLCIVRAQECPADDHYLSTFLRLISDEEGILQVVKRHNVFNPYSDGRERETVPAVWLPRAALEQAA